MNHSACRQATRRNPVLTFWNVVLFSVAALALTFLGLWRVFEKAGRPGWAALVPFYNLVVLLELLDLPLWCLAMLVIPGLELIARLIVCVHLADAFGRGFWFRLGLVVFPPPFLLLLGFDGSAYRGATTPAGGGPIEFY